MRAVRARFIGITRSVSVLFAVSLAQSDARTATVIVDEFNAGGGDRATLLSPCAARLAEPDALTAAVFIGELYAGRF
jgi:hypothetical protein